MPEKKTLKVDEGFEVPQGALGKAAEQQRVRTESFQNIYANNMALSFSSWDVSIIFGEIIGEKDGKPIIEEVVKVTMTREMTKVLATLLLANLKGYEQQFGEIKIPSMAEDDESEAEPAPAVIDAMDKMPAG